MSASCLNKPANPQASKKPFQLMAKPSGPDCNLNCEYCFYLKKEKLFPETSLHRMPDEVLTAYIRQYIESQNGDKVLFVWQGGEPTLLGLGFFRKATALQQEYADGKIIENAMQTNGVLLNDKWAQFLKEHNFLMGVSLDGPETAHNTYRVNKAGKTTFSKVLNGIEYLRKYGVDYNILATVHRANVGKPLEVYHFLKEVSDHHIQFIPIVERTAQALKHDEAVGEPDPGQVLSSTVQPYSVDPAAYGHFLSAVFDEWVQNDVGSYFVQMFEIALQSWMGIPQSLCIFRETCGDALVIEHNGNIYSCDHFVNPEDFVGNVLRDDLAKIAFSEQQDNFGNAKKDSLPRYCRDCEVRFACNGGCPKNRFIRTPDGEAGLNYLCPGYKIFFNHIDPFMKYMAELLRNGQEATAVIPWARKVLNGASQAKVGRNDPCPCGSGLKYKKCCGA